MVREQNAVASVFHPVFCSQFRARWGTTRIRGAPACVLRPQSPTDDVNLNTTRIYVDADACPVKDEIYRVAARHGLPVSVVAGNSSGCRRIR